ncbi:DNA polymerase III subunit psi [Thalassotalea piscium]
MITNAKQFNYLNAMGIDLWQLKQEQDANTSSNQYLAVDLAHLCQQQCFLDVLRSFDITLDQVTLSNDHCINLGLFNWQFTTNSHSEYQSNTLTTPAIEQLTQAPQLKRQLWQLLSTTTI